MKANKLSICCQPAYFASSLFQNEYEEAPPSIAINLPAVRLHARAHLVESNHRSHSAETESKSLLEVSSLRMLMLACMVVLAQRYGMIVMAY